MNRPTLHQLVAQGDLAGVREYLGRRLGEEDDALNSLDIDGCTPLVVAVLNERADAELLRELLSHGALVDVDGPVSLLPGRRRSVVRLALERGDPG